MNPIEYLNSTVWCRVGPSSIHGVGVIAIRDIPKGTAISDSDLNSSVQKPKKVYSSSLEDLHRLLPEVRELILDRMLLNANNKKLLFISPNDDAILQSFMNHSDDANCDGTIALRDIKKGEEVTENFKILQPTPHLLSINHMPFVWK